jgi:hypothetical protein
VGGNTLITDAEKAAYIADRFAESHDISQFSHLTNIVRASCSVLQDSGFNIDTLREIPNHVKFTKKNCELKIHANFGEF